MIAWDTSALVRCYHAHEPGHARALNFLRQRTGHGSSALLHVEAAAAFARFHRHERAQARSALNWLDGEMKRFSLLGVDGRILEQARDIAVRHALRAADSIHLASAREFAVLAGRRSLMVLTADADQAAVAKALGLKVTLIES